MIVNKVFLLLVLSFFLEYSKGFLFYLRPQSTLRSFKLKDSASSSSSAPVVDVTPPVPTESQQPSKKDNVQVLHYLSKEDRPYLIGSKPDSGIKLGVKNFKKEFAQIFLQLRSETVDRLFKGKPTKAELFPEIFGLKLSNEAVKNAELLREKNGGAVDAHPVSRLLYDVGCLFLDTFFDQRPLARFWFLETVARIPYFVYVTMLHLYESLGWWREPSVRKVHYAEEWNELHHLLIMEALGADKKWSDRFLGYHCAILYYWLLIATYLFSPAVAYQFMELLEAHAVDTYGTFVKENEKILKSLPPPPVARAYYTGADLYQFDEFQVSRAPGTRRPPCDNLYDVFTNICDDEWEHVLTMRACQDYAHQGKPVYSRHDNPEEKEEITIDDRAQWIEWSKKVNSDYKRKQDI